MGQRVGANQRQFHRIKNWLKEGVPQHIISKRLNIEPQSLEKICAHIEGREMRHLQMEQNPEYNRLMAENAALKAKLGDDEPEDDEDED
jgi:hypothetical protein